MSENTFNSQLQRIGQFVEGIFDVVKDVANALVDEPLLLTFVVLVPVVFGAVALLNRIIRG